MHVVLEDKDDEALEDVDVFFSQWRWLSCCLPINAGGDEGLVVNDLFF